MPPERTSKTYGTPVTAASKAALLELMAILRSYRDALVLVGGWVPYFLLEQHRRPADPFKHIGSIDIDLAINPQKVTSDQYATVVELLAERGYEPAEDKRGGRCLSRLKRCHHPLWIRSSTKSELIF